jgi:putative sigma-54 modulation protein
MQFSITGKHVEITDAMRQHAQDKVEKLPRYLDTVSKVDVVVEGAEKGTSMQSVEVIASGKHGKVFVAKEQGADVYTCIDLAVHKLERQISKAKEMERGHKHNEKPTL